MFDLGTPPARTDRPGRSAGRRSRLPAVVGLTFVGLLGATTTAQAAVTVSPQPNSQVASPATQLSFRGATVADVGKITVTGSRSGRHRGTVRTHSDGAGASWIPKQRFLSDERVTVRSTLKITGTEASGGQYRIRTARFTALPTAADTKRGDTKQLLSLRTRPDLLPPIPQILQAPTAEALSAKTFLAPKLGRGDGGPMILDERGRMVFFQKTPAGQTATEFRSQTYQGRPVLTYWQGPSSRGEGYGDVFILDQRYHQLARVKAGNGYHLDMHEALITPRGTLMTIIYQPVRYDLRPLSQVQGGVAIDSIVQEIDIATGLVLFEWHSLDHVGLDESTRSGISPRSTRIDYFHMNSVDEDGDGLILSARQTSAVYRISKATGQIDWRLGGRKSDFKMGSGTQFALQHDARVQSDGTIRIFDNSSEEQGKRSRSIVLRLDREAKTATLAADVRLPGEKLFAATQGNSERLPNGGLMIGWGSQARGTEFGPDGKVRFDVDLPSGYDNYRYYRMPWQGRPSAPPKARAKAAPNGATNVWVSWNGATEVARWQVLGPDGAVLGTQVWTSFETWIRVPGRPASVRLRALDAAGNVLGTTKTARIAAR
ncbi:MAG: arylsulfotransferase family protein [Patulibacter sp.]